MNVTRGLELFQFVDSIPRRLLDERTTTEWPHFSMKAQWVQDL